MIVSAAWLGTHTLIVRFETTYADKYYQLYAGRTLVGVSASIGERSVQGTFPPSRYPEHLWIVAVDAVDRLTDFGHALPPRPYNRAEILYTTSGWEAAGAVLSEITGGTAPGGEVDPENLVGRIPFDTDRQYTALSDPLPGTGIWNFAVCGVDGTRPNGNRGTAADVACPILAHPPDLAFNSDGSRLDVAIDAGVATISFMPG